MGRKKLKWLKKIWKRGQLFPTDKIVLRDKTVSFLYRIILLLHNLHTAEASGHFSIPSLLGIFAASDTIVLLLSRLVMSDSLRPHDCSTSDFSVLHHLLKLAQTHVHWVGGAIQPSWHHWPLSYSKESPFPWLTWQCSPEVSPILLSLILLGIFWAFTFPWLNLKYH